MKKIINKLFCMLSAVVVCMAMTGCAPAATGEGAGSGSYSGIILLVAMIAVFYFLLIRPENKKKKQAEEMRNHLSVGDKITTIGGMVGKIVDISGDLITFETGEDRVRVQIAKWGISMNSIDKSGEGK